MKQPHKNMEKNMHTKIIHKFITGIFENSVNTTTKKGKSESELSTHNTAYSTHCNTKSFTPHMNEQEAQQKASREVPLQHGPQGAGG